MSTIRVNRFENTSSVGYGAVLQVVNTQTGAVSTGTTQIPNDDTIPQQSTEGTQFMSLSVTPKSATNKLKITVITQVSLSGTGTSTTALFQDSAENAIACTRTTVAANGYMYTNTLVHYMTAGTTSATTFKVKIGPDSALTVTFNGSAGAGKMGGTLASSITIEEIQV